MSPSTLLLLTIIFSVSLFSYSISFVSAATIVNVTLGHCTSFDIFSGTGVNANGIVTTITSGSVGVSPGTTLSGNLILEKGSIELNTQLAADCGTDRVIAYGQAKTAHCTHSSSNTDLSGRSFSAGTYCFSQIIVSATTVTLDGRNDNTSQWIFQSTSTLTTAPATSIILLNGALAKNVYWAIGTSASIGASSSFVGTILAHDAISLDHNATIIGRVLAQAAVTLAGGNRVTLPVASDSIVSANLINGTITTPSSTGVSDSTASSSTGDNGEITQSSSSGEIIETNSTSSSGEIAIQSSSSSSSAGYSNNTRAGPNNGSAKNSGGACFATLVAASVAFAAMML